MAGKEHSKASKTQLWASMDVPGNAQTAQLCGFRVSHWRESLFKAEVLLPDLLVLSVLKQ